MFNSMMPVIQERVKVIVWGFQKLVLYLPKLMSFFSQIATFLYQLYWEADLFDFYSFNDCLKEEIWMIECWCTICHPPGPLLFGASLTNCFGNIEKSKDQGVK